MNMTNAEYGKFADRLAPKSPCFKNCFHAFWIGGLICLLGQAAMEGYKALGLSEKLSGTATSITLILLSVILTGFAVYDNIAKLAGGGTLVPITGFANSIAAPAIEFQTDDCVIIGLVRKTHLHKRDEYGDLVCYYNTKGVCHRDSWAGNSQTGLYDSQHNRSNHLSSCHTGVKMPDGLCHTVRYLFLSRKK